VRKLILIIAFTTFCGFALLKPSTTLASEGFVELRNSNGEAARCWAASGLMQNLQYKVLMLCRDIIYPGGVDIFNYVVWAMPLDDDKPFQLGTLGLGKAEFDTKTAFRSLFVTKEANSRTRSPQGPVVMQGNVQRIGLLDNPTAAQLEEPELGQPEVTPTPAPVKKSSGSTILRIGGILGFVALFGIILLILVITRK
jgi:hypothetical protein